MEQENVMYCADVELHRGQESRVIVMREADILDLYARVESMEAKGFLAFIKGDVYTVSKRQRMDRQAIPIPKPVPPKPEPNYVAGVLIMPRRIRTKPRTL